LKHKQHGLIKGDVIGILIGAIALGGVLVYGWVSEQPLPLWPAILVALVNLVAAANVFRGVMKAKKQRQAMPAVDAKTPR
jgi:hypothetical protein